MERSWSSRGWCSGDCHKQKLTINDIDWNCNMTTRVEISWNKQIISAWLAVWITNGNTQHKTIHLVFTFFNYLILYFTKQLMLKQISKNYVKSADEVVFKFPDWKGPLKGQRYNTQEKFRHELTWEIPEAREKFWIRFFLQTLQYEAVS